MAGPAGTPAYPGGIGRGRAPLKGQHARGTGPLSGEAPGCECRFSGGMAPDLDFEFAPEESGSFQGAGSPEPTVLAWRSTEVART